MARALCGGRGIETARALCGGRAIETEQVCGVHDAEHGAAADDVDLDSTALRRRPSPQQSPQQVKPLPTNTSIVKTRCLLFPF